MRSSTHDDLPSLQAARSARWQKRATLTGGLVLGLFLLFASLWGVVSTWRVAAAFRAGSAIVRWQDGPDLVVMAAPLIAAAASLGWPGIAFKRPFLSCVAYASFMVLVGIGLGKGDALALDRIASAHGYHYCETLDVWDPLPVADADLLRYELQSGRSARPLWITDNACWWRNASLASVERHYSRDYRRAPGTPAVAAEAPFKASCFIGGGYGALRQHGAQDHADAVCKQWRDVVYQLGRLPKLMHEVGADVLAYGLVVDHAMDMGV